MLKTFGKADLVAEVQKRIGGSKTSCEYIITEVFESVATLLLDQAKKQGGAALNIYNFGTFRVKQYAARPGHNPKTGAKMEIPACKRLSWAASATLKAKFQEAKKK